MGAAKLLKVEKKKIPDFVAFVAVVKKWIPLGFSTIETRVFHPKIEIILQGWMGARA